MFARHPRQAHWLTIALYILFVSATTFAFANAVGDDLLASYVGCKLVADGNFQALFDHSHNTGVRHAVTSQAWLDTATASGFTGRIYNYVQTPLWAFGLQPVCTALDYAGFKTLFAFIASLSFAAIVALSFRYLATDRAPVKVALVLACLWISMPFQFAMYLLQTHAIFLAATLAALLLAERENPLWAGLLLAIAAAIKITPGLLVLYWLVTRRWKATLWFALFSVAILAITWAIAGTEVMLLFIRELQFMSGVPTVAIVNQSLALAIMGPLYHAQSPDFALETIPAWIKLLTTGLALASISLVGFLRNRGVSEGSTLSIALIAITAFAPVAWAHYYVILVVPFIWMLGRTRPLVVVPSLLALVWTLPYFEIPVLLYAGLAVGLACALYGLRQLDTKRYGTT